MGYLNSSILSFFLVVCVPPLLLTLVVTFTLHEVFALPTWWFYPILFVSFLLWYHSIVVLPIRRPRPPS